MKESKDRVYDLILFRFICSWKGVMLEKKRRLIRIRVLGIINVGYWLGGGFDMVN